MMGYLGPTSTHQVKKNIIIIIIKNVKVLPPLTKLSGSAHDYLFTEINNYCETLCKT